MPSDDRETPGGMPAPRTGYPFECRDRRSPRPSRTLVLRQLPLELLEACHRPPASASRGAGIRLSRATLTQWTALVAELLESVAATQHGHILAGEFIAMDETPIKAGRNKPGRRWHRAGTRRCMVKSTRSASPSRPRGARAISETSSPASAVH